MTFNQLRRREFIALLGGAAVAWPLVARSPEDSPHMIEAFRRGLKEGGFVEGENVAIEFRWARGDYSRLPALAADLVGRRVTVITAVGGEPSPLAAKQATSTIPIVFGIGGDPVSAGLVQSFNRPGGNVTGVTLLTNAMEPKRLGLLRELAPGVAVVGALVNPNFPPAAQQAHDIQEAARAIGQRIIVANASGDDGLESAFVSLVRDGIGALLVASDPYFDTRRDRIVSFAAQQRWRSAELRREHYRCIPSIRALYCANSPRDEARGPA